MIGHDKLNELDVVRIISDHETSRFFAPWGCTCRAIRFLNPEWSLKSEGRKRPNMIQTSQMESDAFAQLRKSFLRSRICEVIEHLLADPGFRHAYASNSKLRETLGHTALGDLNKFEVEVFDSWKFAARSPAHLYIIIYIYILLVYIYIYF